MSQRKAWVNSTRSATLPTNWRSEIRPAVFDRDNHTCQINYANICTTIATEVDHIGDRDDHSMRNLQAACEPCNARKNIITRGTAPPRRRPSEPHPGLKR